MQRLMDQSVGLKTNMHADLAGPKGGAGEAARPDSASRNEVGGVRVESVRSNGTNAGEADFGRNKKAVFGSGRQIVGRNAMD